MARRARLARHRYDRTAALWAQLVRRTDLPSNCSMAGLKRSDSPPNHRNVATDQRAGLMREESDEGTCAQPQGFLAQHQFPLGEAVRELYDAAKDNAVVGMTVTRDSETRSLIG